MASKGPMRKGGGGAGAGAGAGWPLMVVEWACTACGKMETF